MKKKLLFYFTHKESLGHTTRTLSIIHSLLKRYKKEIEITVFQAGKPQRFLKRPRGSRWFDLPRPYYSKDSFKKNDLYQNIPLYANLRSNYMLDKLKIIDPDIFITEFFPFGREDCRFELVPVLRFLKSRKKRIYASIGYPYIVRSNFKILLHHCDFYDKFFIHTPQHHEFKYFLDGIDNGNLKNIYLRTFRHIKTRVTYTGYVLPFNVGERKAPGNARDPHKAKGQKWIIVSRGGGGRYPKIITSAILAAKKLQLKNFRFLIVSGPSTSSRQMTFFRNFIKEKDVRNVTLLKYIDNLPAYIKESDVSVSMAGYNTSVQLLYFRKPAVLIPSRVDPETACGYCSEQISRAEILKDYIGSRVLDYDALTEKQLTLAIEKSYAHRQRMLKNNSKIRNEWFDGAKTTADLMAQR
jgi:predicted glycosyltransferase